MAGIALMRALARSDVIRKLSLTGRVLSGAEALTYGFAASLHADPLAAAGCEREGDRRPQRGRRAGAETAPQSGERRRRSCDPPRRIPRSSRR